MKRFVTSAAIAGFPVGLGHADISVATPKQPVSKEAADAYVAELDSAVRRVCLTANSPLIGVTYYRFTECLKLTRADVATKDPTGLFASRQPADSTVLAAR